MATLAVLYRPSEDPETFEKRYLAEHLPLVRQWPDLKEHRFGRVKRALTGEFRYSHIFLGSWDDKDAMKAALSSDAATAAVENAKEIAPQGFDMVVLEWLE